MNIFRYYSVALFSVLFLFVVFSWPGSALADSGFSVVATQNPDINNRFTAISSISSSNTWAVGHATGNASGSALIEHWDGSSWAQQTAANPGANDNSLNGIKALSSTNIWAVGSYTAADNSTHTLIEHSTDGGQHWSEDTSYQGPGQLVAIDGSGNDAWAVGSDGTSPLTFHLSNGSWSSVANPASSNAVFYGVSEYSNNDVWVVGYVGNTAFTMHWEYDSVAQVYKWVIKSTPSSIYVIRLLGVVDIGPNNAWAVGNSTGGSNTGIIMHWNGSVWSSPVDFSPSGTNILQAISATSANDLWIVGENLFSRAFPLVLHSSDGGANWAQVSVENPSTDAGTHVSGMFLSGVVVDSTTGKVTTSGYFQQSDDKEKTVIESFTPTLTSNFDILTDGYSFANAANTATWAEFEQTFGRDQVDTNSGKHKPLAQIFYEDQYAPLLSAGNCFGVAATSLLFYTGNDSNDLLGQNSVSHAHDLPDPGLISGTQIWNSTPVSRDIAKFTGTQLGLEMQENESSQSQNILDVYNSVKQSIQQGFSDPFLIGIVDINDKGGHALVPYKIEDDQSGISKIFVYDPNDPCQQGSPCTHSFGNIDPYNRYIKIDFNANPITWDYEFQNYEIEKLFGFNLIVPIPDVWENPKIYTVPISLIKQKSTLSPLGDDINVIFTGLSDLYFTNSQGSIIGFQNGSFMNTISGANVNVALLDGSTKISPSYTLPVNSYTIHVQGKQTENDNLDIFGTNTLLQVANLPVASGSADTVATDQDHRSMTISTQDARKVYEANLYSQTSSISETKEFSVSGLSIAQGESEKLAMTSDNQSVEITNNAQTQTIHITIKETGTRIDMFQPTQAITINQGDRVIITPTDWNNLATSNALIQVDQGNTGGALQNSYLLSQGIAVSPASSSMTVGTPVTLDVQLIGGDQAFNAARASVAVSSNLSIIGIHTPSSNACNLQYTQSPTTTNPSFAGAIVGTSSSGCTVYQLTVTPTGAGTGTITFSNASLKSYADGSEILQGVQNGTFTITSVGPTATPTAGLSQLTLSSPSETYTPSFTLSGTKDSAISSVFVNGSASTSAYPTSTTWHAGVSLTLGANTFTFHGKDAGENQTATQTTTVNLHTLGDINGDGVVDLTDASLFAVDWDKTSNLTYILSDMNGDGSADLTDLSILAKLETE